MCPIFEYSCNQCQSEFEMFYKSQSEARKAEEDGVMCPICDCQDERVKKKISKSDFELKGRGWASSGYGLRRDKS